MQHDLLVVRDLNGRVEMNNIGQENVKALVAIIMGKDSLNGVTETI